MKPMRFLAVILLLALYGFSCPFNQQDKDKVNYSILSNFVRELGEKKTWRQRQMTIMIDPADFTDDRLRLLAKELLEKFPDPDNFAVHFISHDDQSPIITGERSDKAYDTYPHGGLTRYGGNEYIRYMVPPSEHWRTIVLKGKDPSDLPKN